MSKVTDDFRCGYVALIGRPNVGKSTLMNQMLGQKLSITSRKPQTTRHRILGIKTTESAQVIYVDTPGIHQQSKKAMNRYMNRVATSTLTDVDVIIFMVDATQWTADDDRVLQKLQPLSIPVILVVNKIDKLKDKSELLPYIELANKKSNFHTIVPLSARSGKSVVELEKTVRELLKESPPFFSADQITDRSERFLAAEIVREKLMRTLGQEVPYALTVGIEQFVDKGNLLNINAIIWVDRKNQKAIVIGKQGKALKETGTQARRDMESLFGKKVFLELWVKVKEGWADDERALQSLGYSDDF